ncbi:MAG: LD-carboxypeptidase [Methylacidiphilales bacterium]|nr:LD-carboxypeptidase [Candidatus Methylacidiphilales bacterium]
MSAPSLLFPPRLATGDTIGIAAPASPPEKPEIIDETIDRFTALGFRIKPGKSLRKRDGYLAGGDEERAEDINAFFADPEVRGIFALRGGYGSCRILPLLDYGTIRANPKPLVGYSDITAMQLAILVKAGLVTFHGSNASSAFQPGNEAAFRRMLMSADGSRQPPGDGSEILFSRDDANGADVKTVVSGRATGRLLGGNMTCLLRLLGTPYAPDFRDAILFLEDTGEKAYRVDGMFTHLRLAGILTQISGLVLGRFDHTDAGEQTRITACLQREAKSIGVPAVSGAPIGHFPEQIIIPQGARAELDASAGRLSLAP